MSNSLGAGFPARGLMAMTLHPIAQRRLCVRRENPNSLRMVLSRIQRDNVRLLSPCRVGVCEPGSYSKAVESSREPMNSQQISGSEPPASSPRFEISIFQLAGDEMFRGHRVDGSGWDWSWADWRRDWMDETPSKFAYRCLPLTIANQTGWWVYNPVGFTAVWNGLPGPGGIQFLFDSDPGVWGTWINDQFGRGDRDLEHAVSVPDQARRLAAAGHRAGQLFQTWNPASDRDHRE